MQKISLDTIIPLIIMCVCFFAGWQVNGWVHESDELDRQTQEDKINLERNKAANAVATQVLNGLSEWKQNTETVVKEMHYETTKPIFYNVCATDEYVRMFNEVQNQSRAAITGKSSGTVQK